MMKGITQGYSLPVCEKFILKSITITITGAYNNKYQAVIYYFRKVTDSYYLRNNVSNKEVILSFEYLNSIQEQDYPQDRFDQDLVDTLQEKYGIVSVKSTLIQTEDEIRNLQENLKKCFTKQIEFRVEPDFEQATQQSYACPNFPMILYYNNSAYSNIFKNDIIFKVCPIEKWKSTYAFYHSITPTVELNILNLSHEN